MARVVKVVKAREFWDFPPPEHNQTEQAFDRLEAAWADFLYGVRTDERLVRDGTALEKGLLRTYAQVHEALERFRARFEKGDPLALLHALVVAMEEVVPVPYWVSLNFKERFNRMVSMQSTSPVSMHQAFELSGVLPLSRTRWKIARRNLYEGRRMWGEVRALMQKEKISLDPALTRVLDAGRYPFGKTLARRLFLETEALQNELLGKRQRRRLR